MNSFAEKVCVQAKRTRFQQNFIGIHIWSHISFESLSVFEMAYLICALVYMIQTGEEICPKTLKTTTQNIISIT